MKNAIFFGLLVSVFFIGGELSLRFSSEPAPPKSATEFEEHRFALQDLDRMRNTLELVFNQPIERGMPTCTIPVTVTAYSAQDAKETNAEFWYTADMSPARVGIIAISRDLQNEVGLKMGQRVLLPNYGVFEIRDLMNKRFKRRVDVLMASRKAANLFGIKEEVLIWL
jgi:3D (Asp-Asp-Asp) domain-containing protein